MTAASGDTGAADRGDSGPVGRGGVAGPAAILTELEEVLRDRARQAPAGSYSARLLADPQLAARKIVEEAFEVTWELGRPQVDPGRVAGEAADLVFHLLAGMVGAGVPLDDVWAELRRRRGEGSSDAAATAAGPAPGGGAAA